MKHSVFFWFWNGDRSTPEFSNFKNYWFWISFVWLLISSWMKSSIAAIIDKINLEWSNFGYYVLTYTKGPCKKYVTPKNRNFVTLPPNRGSVFLSLRRFGLYVLNFFLKFFLIDIENTKWSSVFLKFTLFRNGTIQRQCKIKEESTYTGLGLSFCAGNTENIRYSRYSSIQ